MPRREFLALDRIFRQGVWAGSKTRLDDPFQYGGYRVEARDAATGALLFSQGFDSYFGEYRTTSSAAEGVMGTYHESVLLPFPKRPLRVNFSAHRRDGSVVPLLETTIDPESVDIASEPPARGVEVIEIHQGGPPATTARHRHSRRGLHRGSDRSLQGRPRKGLEICSSRRSPTPHTGSVLAIRGVLAPSKESGCDEPTRSDLPRHHSRRDIQFAGLRALRAHRGQSAACATSLPTSPTTRW